MSERFRSYEVARKTFSFLEFIGWSVVALGIIAGLVLMESAGRYANDGQKFLLFMLGTLGSLLGLFLVGCVQNWRAGVDSAEYGQQSLKVAREQLEISKQNLKLQNEQRHSFAALNTGDEDSPNAAIGSFAAAPKESHGNNLALEPTEYRGEEIKLYGGSYRAIGQAFESRVAAQAAIDQKLNVSSLEVALQAPDEQPVAQEVAESIAPLVAQPNGKSEDVPRSFGDLRATKSAEATPAPVEPTKAQTPPKQITEENGKFVFGKMAFSSREAAERYVSQLGVNPNFSG